MKNEERKRMKKTVERWSANDEERERETRESNSIGGKE